MDVVMTLALGSKLQKVNNKSYHCVIMCNVHINV